MKASRFTEAKIAFVLKQAEAGTAVGEVCCDLQRCVAEFLQNYLAPPTAKKSGRAMLRCLTTAAAVERYNGSEDEVSKRHVPSWSGYG